MALSWFKHYNTAHEGLTLRTLWDQEQFEAYGLFWILLELISRFEEEKSSGRLKIPMASLQRVTGWNLQRLTRVLTKIGETSSEVQGIQVRLNLDQTCELFVPKWSKLQETRGGKRLAKKEQKVGRSEKLEVRSKNTPIVPFTGTSVAVEEIPNQISDSELEAIYAEYPKRRGNQGKAVAFKRLRSLFRSDPSLTLNQTILCAVRAYKSFCGRNSLIGTEKVAMFSTFFGDRELWKDWVGAEIAQKSSTMSDEEFQRLAFGSVSEQP